MSDNFDLTVNGTAQQVTAKSAATLLQILRQDLDLTGTRFGCGLEQCGSCKVLIDGAPVFACTQPAAAAAGREITTIEGLRADRVGGALIQAFLAEQAGQCGYCLSGIVISAKALLDRDASPDRAAITAALEDHICRCGSHIRIIRAIQRAAAALRGEA